MPGWTVSPGSSRGRALASTSVTERPSPAAVIAAALPAGPPPITRTSVGWPLILHLADECRAGSGDMTRHLAADRDAESRRVALRARRIPTRREGEHELEPRSGKRRIET